MITRQQYPVQALRGLFSSSSSNHPFLPDVFMWTCAVFPKHKLLFVWLKEPPFRWHWITVWAQLKLFPSSWCHSLSSRLPFKASSGSSRGGGGSQSPDWAHSWAFASRTLKIRSGTRETAGKTETRSGNMDRSDCDVKLKSKRKRRRRSKGKG